MGSKSRNYGIDLLRIFAILGVLFLHILGHGGILKSEMGFPQFSLVWGLEIFAYPAVNCFVLVSGFVGFKEGRELPKVKNIVSIFFNVLFYSVLIAFIMKELHPDAFGTKQILSAFFPISTKQYWFFTAYAGMFVLSPILNLAVSAADEKTLKIFIFIGLGFFSAYAMISGLFSGDIFYLGAGYSVFWFSLVYLVGASLKKLDGSVKIGRTSCLLGAAISFLITWGAKVFFQYLISANSSADLVKYRDLLVSYCSPTVLAFAIFILLFFRGLNIKEGFGKIISFFSSSAFSVYLIHDNKAIREYAIKGRFAEISNNGSIEFLAKFLAIVFGIFIALILIDKIRIFLFRLCAIEKLAAKIGELFERHRKNNL